MKTIRLPVGAVALLCAAQLHAQAASDVVCTGCVGTTDLANSAVTSGKIGSSAVTNAKIASGAVTGAKIKNGSVALDDLSLATQALLDAPIADLTTLRTSASATSIASKACPPNRLAVGASCDCDDVNGTRNYGVLFACQVTASGGVAGCYIESGTYDPFLPPPLATVTAVCLGAVTNDGTVWTPLSASSAAATIEPPMTGDEYQAPEHESASRAVHERVDRQLEKLQQRSR